MIDQSKESTKAKDADAFRKSVFMPTVRGTSQAIKQMEVDLGLLNDQTFGLFARLVWESVRFRVHTQLKQRFAGQEVAHTATESFRHMDYARRVRWGVRFIWSALWFGWISAPRGREWLVLQNARKRLRQDKCYEDVYTSDLVDQIPSRGRVILDPPYHWHHFSPRPHKAWHAETALILGWISKPWAGLTLAAHAREVRRMSAAVSAYLSQVFSVGLDFWPTFDWQRRAFAQATISYRLMFRWLRPSKVLFLVSYGRESMVLAARSLGIPTVELQHGVVTPEHLGYAFHPGTTKISFPDYVLLFGDYWRRTVPWPIAGNRLISIGYPYYEKTREAVAAVEDQNRVVIISQGTIGRELSKFAVALASGIRKDMEIVYKLHPGEVARWRTIYPWLFKAHKTGLITVVDSDHPGLYELLASAHWQIGVNSTAIFEGIGLGCITYLVDLPGIEYMEPLIQARAARVVSEPTEIDWSPSEISVDPDDLFAPNWLCNFRQFLQAPLVLREQTEIVSGESTQT